MSRTHKDSSRRIYYKTYWLQDHVAVEGYGWRLSKTTKPKLRKIVDTEDHWMTTPSWWNNLFHTRPIRNKFRDYTKAIVGYPVDQIAEIAEPIDSKKPHKYYW